jgi:hypothetical protein
MGVRVEEGAAFQDLPENLHGLIVIRDERRDALRFQGALDGEDFHGVSMTAGGLLVEPREDTRPGKSLDFTKGFPFPARRPFCLISQAGK